jgi:hypothetical protein
MTSKLDFLNRVSSGFCAFKASQDVVVAEFLNWQKTILLPLEASLEARHISGPLCDIIEEISPLVSPVRTKNIFIQTKSDWVLSLDNGWLGTDAGLAAVLSRKCACAAVRVVSQPHTLGRDGQGSYGAEIFEMFEGGSSRRMIFCANDGGKWKFGQNGSPYAFEDVSLFTNKSVRDRFTHKMLLSYLEQFHIHAFEPTWYLANGEASGVIVTRVGNPPANYREHE